MDSIYGGLDEAKAEIEKLKADLKCKVEFLTISNASGG
jgi:hypothetical protein